MGFVVSGVGLRRRVVGTSVVGDAVFRRGEWRWKGRLDCLVGRRSRVVMLAEKDEGGREEEKEIIKSAGDTSRHVKQLLGWIAVAGAVGAGVWYLDGVARAEEYAAGYVIEQSLSVDNLFVFLLIFNYFKVPAESQEKVLNWGIVGAIVLRGVFIVTGETLVNTFDFMTLILGGLLFYSSVNLLRSNDDEEEDLSENTIVKFSKKLFKSVDYYDGNKFFTEVKDSVTGAVTKMATPLLICLVVIELSDIVFALDSVPAVLGISRDAKVIYLSNILAVCGLRSIYFILESLIGSLRYLPQSLAVVLAFVGLKLCAGYWNYEVDTTLSLAVVTGLLGIGITASLLNPETKEQEPSSH